MASGNNSSNSMTRAISRMPGRKIPDYDDRFDADAHQAADSNGADQSMPQQNAPKETGWFAKIKQLLGYNDDDDRTLS